MSALRMDVTTRFSNMAGTLKTVTGLHLQRLQRKLFAIKIKEIDADGKSRMLKSTHLNY
jgi:predicted secreted protein